MSNALQSEIVGDSVNESTRSLSSLIGTLSALMTTGALGSGELADLRRLTLNAPDRPVFWRLMACWIAPGRVSSEDEESRWAMILSGMARVEHRPGRRFGAALAEADYSEGRLMKLLRTDGNNFAPLVRRTCIFLSTKGIAVDWTDFARFILTTDSEKKESIRREIARSYYAETAKKENQP